MIKIRELKKRFNEFGFSIECRHLDVEAGSSMGISGGTGSGKTLFTKTVTGLTGSYSGSVEIAMTELRSTFRRKIGYVPFRNVLYPNLTLKEMSHFMLRQYKAGLEEYSLKMDWFSGFWEIHKMENMRISSLTDGQTQAVKFFIAMLHSPSVLIVDEPFNGLGTSGAEIIKDLFNDIQTRGVSVLAVSSSPDLLKEITEKTALITNGTVE